MSRPGGKKRGVKSSSRGRRNPLLSKPFPRKDTVVIDAPAYRGEPIAKANVAWGEWLRLVRGLTQFRSR